MISRRCPAPLWPHLLACCVLAVWIDLGRHHRFENADSIIPILVSLQKWTLFYWEQRRFGMLIPLLAMPARSPLSNLLVQNALTIFAGLAAGLLLARHCVGGREWPLVGWLGNTLMLWLSPDDYRRRLLGTSQPYGAALALASAGLLLARAPAFSRAPRQDRGRVGCVPPRPLVEPCDHRGGAGPRLAAANRQRSRAIRVARGAIPRRCSRARSPSARRRSSARSPALYPYGRDHDDLLPPGEWLRGWTALAARLPEMVGPFHWLAVAGALALAGLLLHE